MTFTSHQDRDHGSRICYCSLRTSLNAGLCISVLFLPLGFPHTSQKKNIPCLQILPSSCTCSPSHPPNLFLHISEQVFPKSPQLFDSSFFSQLSSFSFLINAYRSMKEKLVAHALMQMKYCASISVQMFSSLQISALWLSLTHRKTN